MGLNIYAGLGLRVRENGFSKVLNPHSTDLGAEGGDMFGFSVYETDEGVNFGVNFSFGLKLCYRLNN